MYTHQVEATPVLDTSAYSAADHMSDVFTVTTGGVGAAVCRLESVVVNDKADQGIAFDILFFKSSPTVVSSKNAALDITDAQMDNYVGHVRLVAGDFVDTGNQKVACLRDLNLPIKTDVDGKVYCLLLSQGTGTYAASSLVIKFTFEHEST